MKTADNKENNTNNTNIENKEAFDFGKVLDFCKKNLKYISAAVVVVILVVVLAVTMTKSKDDGNAGKNGGEGQSAENQQQEPQQPEEQKQPEVSFEVDAVPEINALIQNYYTAFVAGDTASLEAYATPVSELEKNYIVLMSQYLNAYENIQCNTKPGLNQGEYAVSVVLDIRFEGVETTAPGLDFFYVRQNESGAYYIDNLYSQFNWENRELELDSQMEEFITSYESQADFVALREDVQRRYDEVLAADENLKNKAQVEIPNALEGWVTSLAAAAGSNAGQDQPAEGAGQDQPTDPAGQEPPADTGAQEPSGDAAGQEPSGDAGGQEPSGDAGGQDESSSNTPEINYVPEGKVLKASEGYNVRKGMSSDSERVGTTEIGDDIKVILSYAEGWTKVEWKGKTGYIRTDLLLNN
ncbi:MAG: hypothetical protein HFI41_01530 [Lachnospiraceae bacterium]|nr:hypothetical protein [Lachnospiraceae bacterium]